MQVGSEVETLYSRMLLIEAPSHRAVNRTCHGKKKEYISSQCENAKHHEQGEIRKSVWKSI
jgi:hypothetical protein